MQLVEQELSIVIVSWNTRELLHECLESVETFASQAETFVVDNGSTDGSVNMVRKAFSNIHLIENHENLGYARANNQGIEASKGRYILLLNSDARLTKDALDKMVGVIHTRADVGICGPRLVYPDGSPQESCGRLPSLWSEVGRLLGVKSRLLNGNDVWRKTPGLRGENNSSKMGIETEVVSGASMLVRRKTLESIGLFDERYFMFNEEVDLCKRALEGGWKVIYIPSALVVHVGGGSTGLTAARILHLYRGKKKYFDKHNGHGQASVLWLVMVFSTWIKVLVYTIRRRKDRVRLWREVGRGLGQVSG